MKIDVNECLFITAHEIKNSLSGIIMGLRRIKDDVKDKEFMELLIEEAERLFLISNDSLTLSKPLKLNLSNVGIKEVLFDVLNILNDDIKKKNINVLILFPDDFPPVLCDREKFKTVFTNLLVNAIHHTPEGKNIRITGNKLKENLVSITFEDEGEGIDLENPRNIFYKFYTKRKDGTGLGLAIVHKIIYEHFGRIDVESEKDKGTRFIITIPTDFHFIERRSLKDRRTGIDRRKR
uniref:histidine kinase n=1 Tax=candidate division WOR-3 bacterium TaxID=2052148 RepID=A0A7C4Y4P2_UNCW3